MVLEKGGPAQLPLEGRNSRMPAVGLLKNDVKMAKSTFPSPSKSPTTGVGLFGALGPHGEEPCVVKLFFEYSTYQVWLPGR